jgi:hypothetical protein
MTYRSNYRRGGYRARPQTPGRVARANARPGPCRGCGVTVPAGAGQLWREESGAWSAVHAAAEWSGSPVSGQYVGGCPAETDQMNQAGHFGGTAGPRPEAGRIAAIAATYASAHPADARPGKYAYTASGARMTERSRRCEDAPCCGCCD